ncbi:MAG: Ada metal-binding domain-containing protein [Rectinemataceae bacterium]|nr:Ada metal-binding domain-containing protein [Rectinemataceae bacterium]
MTIADGAERGKALLGRIPPDILVVLVLILSSTLAFGLGILAGKDMVKAEGKDGFWIEQLPEKVLPISGGPAAAIEAVKSDRPAIPAATSGTYMASKNGTKYYLPTCGSAKRIKAENIVWFQTKAEAEAAGYGPAANCPGL